MPELLDIDTTVRLKMELIRSGLRQGDVAVSLGMDEGYLSKVLNGRVSAPEAFEERFRQALVDVTRERHERALAGAASA